MLHVTNGSEVVTRLHDLDDEVVLWFEHDLYDQLHLLQILARLDPPHVTAVLSDDYLGAQSNATLRDWFAARRPIAAADRRVVRQAWVAFRSADPMALMGLVAAADVAPADRAVRFRHLLPARRRHLQQVPWLGHGLSRSQAQALAAVAGGAVRVRDVFVAANHRLEEAIFMGDSAWWSHIRSLLVAPITSC